MVSGANSKRRSLVSLSNEDESPRSQILKAREEHARNQKRDYSHVFKLKTRFELIRLCCIIAGIEFAYSAETAFVSPILLSIGIEHQHMTMIWGISPLLGFFLAPILGSLSDRCKLPMGRRRPIILLFTIGLLSGLILAPYGKTFGEWMGERKIELGQNESLKNFTNFSLKSETESIFHIKSSKNYYWAIILTIIGTVLLDFNADNIQSPSRAYLLDMCISEDHAKGLSTFSILAGIGGFLGYAIGAVDWEKTFLTNLVGDNIKTVFALVTFVFIFTVITTLTSFREIPLKLLESNEMLRPLTNAAMKREREIRLKVIEDESKALVANKDPRNIDKNDESSEDDKPVSFTQYLKSIVIMPKSMKILCLTNLFCWMSIVSYCLYFTDFVGEAVFRGDPTASIGSNEYIRYEEGVRFGCLGLSIYALTCAIYAMFIEKLIERFKSKKVYIGGMLLYAIAIGILGFWPTKWGVLVFSTTAGIVYATIFTIPFMLIANYHGKGSFKVKKGVTIESCDHGRGLGTDIAIVGSMLFLAQIFVSLSVGWFISLLSSTSAVLYAASLFSFLASVSANFCVYMDL